MSWFFESWTRTSEKNGLIKCRRILGRWKVTVDGFDQSSFYIARMWRGALRRIPRDAGIKKVLLLGLGAGSFLPELARRFPHAHVTAIEWDPVMIEVAERLHLFSIKSKPNLIIDDAFHALVNLQQTFDLIVFDLYQGGHTSPLLSNEEFVRLIRDHLELRGFVLINAFEEPNRLRIVNQVLSCHSNWKYQYNRLALYRKFGQGQVGDPLPSGYVQFREDEALIRREQKFTPAVSIVGETGRIGKRWHHGPFWFEGYMSDQEPKIEPFSRRRMVIWQPLTRLDKPKGWRRSWMQMNARKTGFAEITEPSVYWKSWTSHAQRHRRRWLKGQPYTMEEVSMEPFLEAYRGIRKLLLLKNDFIRLVQKKVRAHGERVHFLAARDPASGMLVAGIAVVDIPESNQSIHLISFIHPRAESSSVGTGIIDFWYEHAVKNKIRFLDFDLFWAPGELRSWKGFSKFKSQFVTHFICYPNPLVRWVGGG